MRFKTFLEENKMKHKTASNLNLSHVNEETIEVEVTGSVRYSESCSSKATNFNKKICKKCHPHSQLYQIILYYCNLTVIKIGLFICAANMK